VLFDGTADAFSVARNARSTQWCCGNNECLRLLYGGEKVWNPKKQLWELQGGHCSIHGVVANARLLDGKWCDDNRQSWAWGLVCKACYNTVPLFLYGKTCAVVGEECAQNQCPGKLERNDVVSKEVLHTRKTNMDEYIYRCPKCLVTGLHTWWNDDEIPGDWKCNAIVGRCGEWCKTPIALVHKDWYPGDYPMGRRRLTHSFSQGVERRLKRMLQG